MISDHSPMDDPAWLFGGAGELRGRCRALDWSQTPLGAVADWPIALRSVVKTVLASGFPNIVLWGPELVQIYNDGYRAVMGVKHPAGLGQPTQECWPEAWHINEPIYERVRSGETVYHEDTLIPLERYGTLEDVYFTLSYSPIWSERGMVEGVLVTLLETTQRVAARRLASERERLLGALEAERRRLAELFRQAPAFLAVLRGTDHVFELANDAYYQLVGHRDIVGKPVADALPEVRGQGFLDLLDRVLSTGESFVGREMPVLLARTPESTPEERFVDFVYQRFDGTDGDVPGIVAHGVDVTEQVKARREIEHLLRESELSRRSIEQANAQLEEQQMELELVNQQLQDNAVELEAQAAELELQTDALDEANAQLRASEERLRDVFAQAPMAVAVLTGPDLVYTIVSPRYAERLGDRRLLGLPLREAIPELAGQGVVEVMQEVYRTGEPYRAPERVVWIDRDRDGVSEEYLFDITYQALKDSAGEVYALTSLSVEVTERVQAERQVDAAAQALARVKEHLTHTFEQAPVAIAVLEGPEHVYTLANPSYRQLVGGRELLNRSVREALPEFQGQGVYERLDAVYRTGTPIAANELSVSVRRDDASEPTELILNFNYQPLRDGDGNVYAITVVAIDVSPQVRAREVLQDRHRMVAESERQLRTLADAIPTLVFTARPDGYLDWCNAQWSEYTGATSAELEGWGWQRVHDPEMLPTVLERWTASIASGEPFEMTVPLRRADGRFRAFLTRVTPMRDADGRVVRWFGTNTDVEDEHKSRQQVERLQALTASLATARTLDDAGALVIAEATAAAGAKTGALFVKSDGDELMLVRQTGLSDEMAQRYASVPISIESPAAECIRTGRPVWIEARDGPTGLLSRFSGVEALWQELEVGAVASVPLCVGGGVAGAISFTFSSPRSFDDEDRAFFIALGNQAAQAVDRAQLFAAEHRARSEAEEANRVKSQFLANMSHELRTPLNAISGYADLLLMGLRGTLTDAQRDDVERMRRSGQHLLSLINDILNFAKLEAGQVDIRVAPVSAASLLENVEDLVRPQAVAKSIRLVREQSDPMLLALADAEKAQQILLNLLTNAVKFTPAQGEIATWCDVHDEWLQCHVRDTGRGIPADQLQNIFDPFVQVDRHLTPTSQQGVGLGLAISRDLAAAMGGSLTARSEVGRGSVFTLRLPLA